MREHASSGGLLVCAMRKSHGPLTIAIDSMPGKTVLRVRLARPAAE
jgi:hypothetical protein